MLSITRRIAERVFVGKNRLTLCHIYANGKIVIDVNSCRSYLIALGTTVSVLSGRPRDGTYPIVIRYHEFKTNYQVIIGIECPEHIVIEREELITPERFTRESLV